MIIDDERPIADRLDGVPVPGESMKLIGHQNALGTLAQGYRSGRLHHAWLISGSRGIGKATLAFHMARYILSNPNAETAAESTEPNLWPQSVVGQVAQASHPDLLHLTRPWDEKGKRFKTQLSVEEIRKTQGFYSMTAGGGGWRITIVDAADDMNASAANALLKILEEPPKRSLFFIITHSAGSLLPTIRSRCQHMPLQPLSDEDVLSVANGFDLGAKDDELAEIASVSEGSVRRAIVLTQGGVLKPYRTFLDLMTNNAAGSGADWQAAHAISDAVCGRGREESYFLFTDLVVGWIAKQVRPGNSEPLHKLAGWSQVWEKANQSIALADAFNLDKKQVILSLFGSLFAQNRG